MKRLSMSLALGALLLGGSLQAGEETIRLAPGKDRDRTAGFCATCHSLDYITMNAPLMDRDRWEKTIAKMIDVYKAPIGKQDAAAILEYLTQNYAGAR